MPPTVVSVGAVISSLNAITPAWPTGLAVNDIILGVGESNGGQNYPTAASNGFAHVSSDGTPVSPVVEGVNTQLTAIWRRYDGTGAAHDWGDSGDHNIGRYIAIRGCPTVGNPWHAVGVASSPTSSTAATFPGCPTVTVTDTLVVEIIATGTDIATGQLATITNANYTAITSRMNDWTTSGAGGGFALLTGLKAASGATGQSTGTLTTAATKAMMTLVFMNAPAATKPRSPIIVSHALDWDRY